MNPETTRPEPTEPAALRVLGTTLTPRIAGAQTEGAYAMFELLIPPGEGMVPHRHELEAEQLYVLEGRLAVRLEDGLTTLEPGQSLLVPRGAVHAHQSVGSGPARVLQLVSPGFLHEKFYAEVGRPADAHDVFLAVLGLRGGPKTPLEPARLAETASAYHIEILPLE